MLEIIALIFLAREIGKIAVKKGLRPGRWKLYFVLSWFAGEFAGAFIGILFFGTGDWINLELMALAGAVTGFVVIRAALVKKPDALEDEISQIGNNT